MAAQPRSQRGARRRRLGQNFLRAELASRIVAEAGFRPDEFVVEIGPGGGAFTLPLARAGVEVLAIELDAEWAARLRARLRGVAGARVRVLEADVRVLALPRRPFRVLGSLPFGATTDILHRLLDDPRVPLERADLVVQWEVARKRTAVPPATLLGVGWAPWWEFRAGARIAAAEFRPVPRVDAALLTITRRSPPLLPDALARAYVDFVRARWPFARER